MMVVRLLRKFKNQEFSFTVLFYIVLFIFLLYPYRDYDWGWHYRLGEYLVQNGRILFADPFSWSMEGFVWANHEWLYDPFHYFIFNASSFLGMSVIGALIALSWFYFGTTRFKLSYWQKGILALFFANLVGGVIWQGLRVQMVGTFFMALLVYLMPLLFQGNKRVLFGLPLLFVLWANVHGYFIIGLVIFGLMLFGQIVAEAYLKRKEGVKMLYLSRNLLFGCICFVASTLGTLVNPFTYHIYLEGLKHLNNPLLPYILEWTPFQWYSSFGFVILVYSLFIIGMAIKRRNIKDLPYLLLFIFMLYYALTARRYVSTFMVITLPLASLYLSSIPLRLEKYKVTAFFFLLSCIIALEIGLFRRIPNYHLLNYTFEDYCNFGSTCSERLVEYLKKNPPKGKGFNYYDWGGYFIGRGVPAKLFVDGRMHLWKDPKTGFEAFNAYQQMYYNGNYNLFRKYDFDWLIIASDSPLFEKISSTKELGLWNAQFIDGISVYLTRERGKK